MIFIREIDLQTMCLNVIVHHMHYLKNPNDSTKLYVEFLRRCYSDRLFSLLEEKNLYPEQHVEWLLSPYWKNVSLPMCIHYPMSNIIRKLQIMGHTIVSLNLENSSCSTDILSAIVCCVPNVTCLNLRSTFCTDNLMPLIRKMCISLNTLNLSNCNITNSGMMKLCNVNKKDSGFDSLKVLNISKTGVTQKGVALILKHLPSLQWLGYKNLSCVLYSLHKSDAQNSPVRYNLKNFEYNQASTPLKDVLKVCTLLCPFVTTVHIQDEIEENDYYLQLLTKFQYLNKLKIVNVNYSLRGTVSLPSIAFNGSILTELEIMHTIVSIDHITYCYNLKRIVFFNVTFEDFYPSEINELNSLTSFTVKHLNLQRDFAFKSITSLMKASKNLNELYIHYVEHFSDTLADTILELSKLTLLDFSFVDISDNTLLRFLKWENMTRIRVDGYLKPFDRNSDIWKLVNENNQFGNTCSWVIDYSELGIESRWDLSFWSGEIYS